MFKRLSISPNNDSGPLLGFAIFHPGAEGPSPPIGYPGRRILRRGAPTHGLASYGPL